MEPISDCCHAPVIQTTVAYCSQCGGGQIAPVGQEERTRMSFRAGDTVKHGPSGETWVMACDQDGEHVWPAGWPESRADASDCVLVEAADDVQRLAMLKNVADMTGHDARVRLARRQLRDLR